MPKYVREEKELDRLELENRALKQENRSLRKKLKTLSRGYYKFMFADTHELEKEAIEEAKKIARKVCWDCQGTLNRIDVGNRYFYQCEACLKTTHSKPISNNSQN